MKENSSVQPKKCRVCGGRRLEVFLDLGDQPHGDSFIRQEDLDKKEPYYPLQACFCFDCTAVQINYTVPKEVMFGEYLYVSGTTRTLREHFVKSTDRLVKLIGLRHGDFVVDIGSNDGTWLSAWQAFGVRSLGIEGAKNLAALANDKGLETWPRFFNLEVALEIIAKNGRPKLVTAAGVFFHLEELHSVTEGIRELIKDGGVFCVQAIYLGKIIGDTQFDQIYHEHLTYWSLRSISHLLDMYGLEVFNARLLPIHGGSLELLISLKGSRPISENVGRLAMKEKVLELDNIETYKRFSKRVSDIRSELLSILGRYVKEGKRVFALGAPIKGSTLLNSFNITTDLVECAVEINPLKIGKYIPGVRVPIRDETMAGRPSVYMVLSWNFLEELLFKMKDYILGGGAFIVPVPRPVVIDKNNYSEYIK